MRKIILPFIAAVVALGLGGCGSDSDEPKVESKPMCIVEAAKRLKACGEDNECAKGIARFAGYCYNSAPGDQMDICRGGSYFFERPLKELAVNHPVLNELDKKQREIIVRSGEVYCNYNYN